MLFLPTVVIADITFFDNSNDAFIMGGAGQQAGQTPGQTPALVSSSSKIKAQITCIAQITCEPWGLCKQGEKTRTCREQSKNCPDINEERTETIYCDSQQEQPAKIEEKYNPTIVATTNNINQQKIYPRLVPTVTKPIINSFLFSVVSALSILVLLISIVLNAYKHKAGRNKRKELIKKLKTIYD